MKLSITTFLMFDGKAEEAINFYVPLFPDSGILSMERYAAGQGRPRGNREAGAREISRADISLHRQSRTARVHLHARHFAFHRMR